MQQIKSLVVEAHPMINLDLLDEAIKDFHCHSCEEHKRSYLSPILAFSSEARPNVNLGMDPFFVNSVPILYGLDHFSKFVVMNRVKSKEPWDVLTMFIISWVRYFGVPRRIITDMGKEFDNKVFRFVGERLGIKLDVTPSGALWSLGQVEAKHENLRRMIEQALK